MVYAVLGVLPRTDYKLRVWMMLVARFLVGSGTGQSRVSHCLKMPAVAIVDKVKRKYFSLYPLRSPWSLGLGEGRRNLVKKVF